MEPGQIVWKPSGRPDPLDEGRVDLWKISLREFHSEAQALARQLSESEVQRADRFVFERDRRDFIVGRSLLRSLLGMYLDLSPARLEIQTDPLGKPRVLQLFQNKRLTFNISHSYGLCVMAFCLSRQLGIDIERFRDDVEIEDTANKLFARDESEWLGRLRSDEERKAGFFTLWTRKEALAKAIGKGLHLPLSALPAYSDQPSFVLQSREGDIWRMRTVVPQDDYVGALVTEGNTDPPLRCLEYTHGADGC